MDRTDSSRRVKTAVIGASGYAGEELVRLLLGHPQADLVAVTSRQYAGQTLAQVFPRFAHRPQARELHFADPNPELLARQAEIVFLALPHGVAAEFAGPLLKQGCRVIDLSADFRLRAGELYQEFYGQAHPAADLLQEAVYGLPEVYREQIREASLVACPGCYPTSILLPLWPLLQEQLIQTAEIIANSLSGVSGAGRKVEADYLFAECNESIRPYGLLKHRHISEIEQELSLAAGEKVTVQFTPHLIPVTRGIITTLYLVPRWDRLTGDLKEMESAIAGAYARFYQDEPFIRLLEGKALPDTKHVGGSNFLDLAWRLDPRTRRLIVMSAEDNIVKGASGQAIQNFNIMSGFPETSGLL
jgi:N-acetyl-gamma-glutamyl-phosphate reductase